MTRFSTEAPDPTLSAPPEPGQLVEVRRRQWIVSDVDASAVAPELPKQNLVKLESIDEDALGEELEVVWELEPGAHVIERAGLPALVGLDDSAKLEAFLDAVRWGAATNADRGYLQAPFRSGVSIEDYQLDPLVRAIDMARTNLLIADDVGLGKTIEAGLVVQEMLLRHRARTILVLCPSSLQEKWRTEMAEKFGLEFRIVDTGAVKRLRRERGLHANPWTSFPRLIASIDWAKQGEGIRLLRDVLPPQPTFPRRFDMLILDEAHNLAPTVGKYAVESLRTRLVRLLAPHFQHKLFLTATPHDGYTESFTALLELLDDQRFSRNILPPEDQLARVMVRRLKSDLVDAKGKRLYPVRRLEALDVQYTADEREARKLLEQYIASREKHDEREGAASHFVHQLLRKRLASSPAAFSSTFARHLTTIEGTVGVRRGSSLDDSRDRRERVLLPDAAAARDPARDGVPGWLQRARQQARSRQAARERGDAAGDADALRALRGDVEMSAIEWTDVTWSIRMDLYGQHRGSAEGRRQESWRRDRRVPANASVRAEVVHELSRLAAGDRVRVGPLSVGRIGGELPRQQESKGQGRLSAAPSSNSGALVRSCSRRRQEAGQAPGELLCGVWVAPSSVVASLYGLRPGVAAREVASRVRPLSRVCARAPRRRAGRVRSMPPQARGCQDCHYRLIARWLRRCEPTSLRVGAEAHA